MCKPESILARRTNQTIIRFCNFSNPRTENKENKRINKYFDRARDLKKLWNMKLVVIPIITGSLGTVSKSLQGRLEELQIRDGIKTIQTTALFRLARILRRVLEIWWDLRPLRLEQKKKKNKSRKQWNNNNNRSTLVGYLIPYPVHIYIYIYIYVCVCMWARACVRERDLWTNNLEVRFL